MAMLQAIHIRILFGIILPTIFPTYCLAEVCDKLRPNVRFVVSPVDSRLTKAADDRMTTWMDYLGDLLFQLATPIPMIALVSILAFILLRRRVLLYISLITSLIALIKLLIYVFEKQDDDLQFAMWEGCVLFPYGTFLVLVAITTMASFRIFKLKKYDA